MVGAGIGRGFYANAHTGAVANNAEAEGITARIADRYFEAERITARIANRDSKDDGVADARIGDFAHADPISISNAIQAQSDAISNSERNAIINADTVPNSNTNGYANIDINSFAKSNGDADDFEIASVSADAGIEWQDSTP